MPTLPPACNRPALAIPMRFHTVWYVFAAMGLLTLMCFVLRPNPVHGSPTHTHAEFWS